jgi:Glycogen recognition site of AMP-activated protein kinase
MKREHQADDDEEAASQPVSGLARLRDVDPPPSLVAGVMQRLAEPRPPSLWRWLRRPWVIQLRLSPLSASGLALGMALVAVLALRLPPAPQAPIPSAPASASTSVSESASPPASTPVRVRFHLQAKGARRVSLVGSFNQWGADRIVLDPVSDGTTFAGTVELPPGTYEYMFVVDGRWVTDPAAEERRDDGFGRQNALLRL